MTIALHLILGGHATRFSRVADRLSFLDGLCTFAPHYECAIHAYVLMTNHVHLLVTPGDAVGGSELALAIWDENREVRPIRARRYLLSCMRYIELNPVRAQIVPRAADYRWSSFRANALGYIDPIVTPHPLYYALGRSTETRRAAYARFVRRGFARPDIASP